MLSGFVERVRAVMSGVVERMETFVRAATRPAPVVVGLLSDLPRSREQLIAENALLRQQLKSVDQSAKPVDCRRADNG